MNSLHQSAAKVSVPLLALLLAGLYVSTLIAQNQPPINQPATNEAPADGPPAEEEEQVEVVIPDTGGVLRRQLNLIIPSDRTPADGAVPHRSALGPAPAGRAEPVQSNPFAGRVVLLETFDRVYPPYENVQIQSFAGHSFFVIDGVENDQPAYQMWLAVGSVQSVRLFDRMRDAEQFLRSGRVGR